MCTSRASRRVGEISARGTMCVHWLEMNVTLQTRRPTMVWRLTLGVLRAAVELPSGTLVFIGRVDLLVSGRRIGRPVLREETT